MHLTAAQGAKRYPELEYGDTKPPFPHSYGTLALAAASIKFLFLFIIHQILRYYSFQVQHALLLYSTDTITLEMICATGKAPS